MSKTMNTPPTIRWQLLSTVSALALLTSAYAAGKAEAAGNDADRPQLWIELGGQAENISGQGEIFVPAFLSVYPNSSVLWKGTSPLQAQKPPLFDFGEDGKISFQPGDSDWVFSAAIRIGRSSGFKHVDHQTSGLWKAKYINGVPATSVNTHGTEIFAETQVHRRENHTVLDFSAGQDVGLGMFGRDGSSVLSLGVRFAQFSSKATFDIRARPDLQFKYQNLASFGHPSVTLKIPGFHTYHASGHASRDFSGIGPSLSWNGSMPFLGNPRDGETTFDWGANAALLFGRQRASVRHQESGHYLPLHIFASQITLYQHATPIPDRSRSVTVPNVGGFAGLSWHVQDFKISLGYRADFFFGAVDGGIDARKNETLGSKGPFASVSFGLGD